MPKTQGICIHGHNRETEFCPYCDNRRRVRELESENSILHTELVAHRQILEEQRARLAESEARCAALEKRPDDAELTIYLDKIDALQAKLSQEEERYAELDRNVSEAIGTCRYLDLPDGGSVPLHIQVRRMKEDLAATKARLRLSEAERDALKLDGERYRWLRDTPWESDTWPPKLPSPPWGIHMVVEYSMPTNKPISGPELDAAIDAAIAKEGETTK